MQIKTYRAEFDYINEDYIFLNHAGVSPLPNRTAEAMRQAITWAQDPSGAGYGRIKDQLIHCRATLARMLQVPAAEIALSRNTTEGLNWVANGIDWKPGDRIVSINNEYPANIYPWMRLEQCGVDFYRIEPIDSRVPVELLEKALTPNTRLVTLSFVAFSTGFRADLEAIGALCQSRGILFVVDFIQGMGVFPLDLKKWNVSFAAGGAQKWLLGPQGAGFFYCPQENRPLLDVTVTGADSVKTVLPYTDYDFTLRDDTARFEYGTHAVLPLIGMASSADMLLEAGLEPIQQRVKTLTDILVDGASQKGYRCISPREDNEWSGIVMLDHPQMGNDTVAKNLKQKKILASEREGYLRLAPHFYQTEEEMKHVVDCL